MEKPKKRLILKKFDYIIIAIIFVISGLSAFLFLGNNRMPSSSIEFNTGDSSYQTESVTFEMPAFNKQNLQIWYYVNSTGRQDSTNKHFSIYIHDGVNSRYNIGSFTVSEFNLYGYYQATISIPKESYDLYNYIQIETSSLGISVAEFMFYNTDTKASNIIAKVYGSVEGKDYSLLVDESRTFGDVNNSYNKMQGVESDLVIGAQELLQGKFMSKHSILPLAKGLVALGVNMFGYNLLGFRFMSALFGMLSCVVVYLLSRAIFKKTYVAAIASGLYLLLGTSLHAFRIASLYNFMTFFILCGFLCVVTLINAKKTARFDALSYVLLSLSAICFSLAMSINLWAVSALIGGFLLFSYYMIDRIMDNKKIAESSDSERAKVKLKKQDIIMSTVGVLSYIIIPMVVYFVFYTIGFANKFLYESKLSYINYISLFEFFSNNQKYIFDGLMAKSGSSNMWLWLVGFGNTSIVGQKIFLQNMALCIFSLSAFLYYIYYLIAKGGKNVDTQLYSSNKRILIILLTGFISCILPYTFQYAGLNVAAFLPASVFFIGFLALMIRQIIYSHSNVMFNINATSGAKKKSLCKISYGIFIASVIILSCIIMFSIFIKDYLGIL